MPVDDRTQRGAPVAVGTAELLRLGLVFGALGGLAFGAWDLHHAVSRPVAQDLPWIAALTAPPGAAVGLVPAVLLAGALALRGRRPTRALAAAVLVGVGVAAVLALGSVVQTGLARATRLALLGGALVLGPFAFGALLLPRVAARLAERWRPEALAASAALAILALAGGPALLRHAGGPTIPAAVWLVAGLVGVGLALLAWRGAAGRVVVGLCVALGAALLALAVPRPDRLESIPAPQGSAGAPNVVLVVLDTTRRDHLGCYGSSDALSPVVDEVAAGGVVYEDAFSPSNWTVPSHASLFTGLPPVSHGLSAEHRMHLDEGITTLAERLGAHGYERVALCSNPWLERTNMLQGFDRSVQLLGRYYGLSIAQSLFALGLPARWTDKGGDEAARALRAWLASRAAPERPFFLSVNLLEPHAPYYPPRGLRAQYLPDDVSWGEANRVARTLPVRELHQDRRRDAELARVVRALYRAGIRYQDHCLGALLDVLDACTDLDETILVVTADHGENLDDDGRWGHQFALNDALVHVPLVIRYPPLFPAGERIAGACSLIDVMPTILAAATGAPPENGPGRSLVPGQFRPRAAVFGQMYPHFADFTVVQGSGGDLGVFSTHWRSIRTTRWKLVWGSDGEHVLHDLEEDPGETRNVVSEHPDLVAELLRRLEEHWSAQPPFEPVEDDPGGASLELLDDLGYGGR